MHDILGSPAFLPLLKKRPDEQSAGFGSFPRQTLMLRRRLSNIRLTERP
jgi:hypothetical protein